MLEKLLAWIESKLPKRRQARYVLNVASLLDQEQHAKLVEVTTRFTPVIAARQFNKLPDDLKPHFIRVGKPTKRQPVADDKTLKLPSM
jgi:hypothetical protein